MLDCWESKLELTDLHHKCGFQTLFHLGLPACGYASTLWVNHLQSLYARVGTWGPLISYWLTGFQAWLHFWTTWVFIFKSRRPHLTPGQWFSNFSSVRITWGTYYNRSPCPTSRVSDAGGLGWGPRICISNRFPSDADVAGPGTTLWETLIQTN